MKMAPARQVEYVSLEYCVSEKESEKYQMHPPAVKCHGYKAEGTAEGCQC